MDADRPEQDTAGIGLEDLPTIMRELFDQCVGDALELADPDHDFQAFIEALWRQVDSAFSLTRHEWPAGAPKPWSTEVDELRGVAEGVLDGSTEPGTSES